MKFTQMHLPPIDDLKTLPELSSSAPRNVGTASRAVWVLSIPWKSAVAPRHGFETIFLGFLVIQTITIRSPSQITIFERTILQETRFCSFSNPIKYMQNRVQHMVVSSRFPLNQFILRHGSLSQWLYGSKGTPCASETIHGYHW